MNSTTTVQLNQPERIQEFIARSSFNSYPYTNRSAIAVNLEETKQELDSLFSTRMYERPYLPEYYNPLEELIGELWTESMENMALQLVVDKVNQFIPYLVIDEAKTAFNYANYKVNMELVFYYEYDFNKVLYSYERQFNTIT